MDDADEPLANALTTLGSPVRLRILRQLRAPKVLREIEVASVRPDGGRTASRQTVREHLDRLLEVGMVVRRPAQRPYGETHEFVLNHSAIFALGEEVRGLARMRATVEPAVETAPLDPADVPAHDGPRLVVVKGLDEGTTFDLRPEGRAEWVLGRRPRARTPGRRRSSRRGTGFGWSCSWCFTAPGGAADHPRRWTSRGAGSFLPPVRV